MYYMSSDQPCSDAIGELQLMYQRVQTTAAAMRLWDRVLTSLQHQQLGGDLVTAYKDSGGTIGIWAKLRRIPPARALVEVAHVLGFVDTFTGGRMLRELNLPGDLPTDPGLVPVWRKDRSELLLGGQVVRRVARTNIAKLVVRVLDAFEEDGWTPRIDDPLLGGKKPNRLRRTIETLNTNLIGMRFHADGTGEGVRWELLPTV